MPDKKIMLKAKNKRIIFNEEIFILFIIAIFTILYFIQILELSRRSRLLPVIITVIVSGLILIRIWKSINIVKNKPHPQSSENVSINQKEKVEKKDIHKITKIFFPLISILILAFAITYIGTYIAVPIFIILSMRYYGVKNWWNMIIISAITTLFLYLLFGKWLMTPLPSGIFLTN